MGEWPEVNSTMYLYNINSPQKKHLFSLFSPLSKHIITKKGGTSLQTYKVSIEGCGQEYAEFKAAEDQSYHSLRGSFFSCLLEKKKQKNLYMTLGLSSLHVQMSHGFCYIHDNTVLLFLKTEVITDISASLYLFGEAKAREFTL